ncbi:hypothetical protein B0O99DRAFT_1983 [Bisporella sp. PMI_857]|nr:hypothetical protein B0O99DRAFT_1983 [Bisporella sp. PMI_857]
MGHENRISCTAQGAGIDNMECPALSKTGERVTHPSIVVPQRFAQAVCCGAIVGRRKEDGVRVPASFRFRAKAHMAVGYCSVKMSEEVVSHHQNELPATAFRPLKQTSQARKARRTEVLGDFLRRSVTKGSKLCSHSGEGKGGAETKHLPALTQFPHLDHPSAALTQHCSCWQPSSAVSSDEINNFHAIVSPCPSYHIATRPQ